MEKFISELIQSIYKGDGFTLSFIGMAMVFIGLFSLFISIRFLEKIIILGNKFSLRMSKTPFSKKKAELLAEAINMEEISAAIGLAFHLLKLQHSPYKITIKRLTRSTWKESLRVKAMERL